MPQLLSLLTLLVAVVAAMPAQCYGAAINTTICAIAASPKKFDGKVVIVRGRYEGNAKDYTVVVDEACGNVGLVVAKPEHFPGDRDLYAALAVGGAGVAGMDVRATFVGLFVFRPRSFPPRVIRLREVRSVISEARVEAPK